MSGTDAVLWTGLALLVVTWWVGRRRLLATPGGRRLLDGRVGVLGWTGVVVLVLVLAPPVDAWSERSVAVHMAQHLGVLLLATPLLVRGRAVAVLGAAAPRPVREQRRHRAGDSWTRPLLAAAALAVVWWAWHVPALYQAAVEVPVVHGLEHVTILAVAWLFWAVVLDDRSRNEPGATVLAVFATALHMGALAALLSFTATPWLGGLVDGPMSPLVDQQVAGGLMWIPGGTTWIAVGTWLVWRWFRDDEAGNQDQAVASRADARQA